jgi:hypothetical protein
MADNRKGQMKATQNVKVRFAVLVTAAVLCVGVIPSGAHSSFGHSPQNIDSKRKPGSGSARSGFAAGLGLGGFPR